MAAHEHGPEEAPAAEATARVPSAGVLAGTGAILLGLTALLIAAARADLGAAWGLVVVIAIASVQASLVALHFMRLRWDRSFHAVLVMVGLLAVVAFIAFAVMDTGQTEPDIIWRAAEPAVVPP